MILSLDSNVLIDVIKGRTPSVREAFHRVIDQGMDVWVSVIVAHEVRFGAALSGSSQEHRTIEHVLSSLAVAPFDEADADGATLVRLALERTGRRIGAMDMLIAGQAIARSWTLVTGNVREFGRVPNLQVIDWTVTPHLP